MRFSKQLIAVLLLSIPSLNAFADFYRYEDENGKLVVAYRLTPEAITQGYEVINSQGIVVATIEPAKTKSDREAERSAAEQRDYDLHLLMKYGDINELNQAIARREADLADEISLKSSKLEDIRASLRATEDRAGLEERQDGVVSEATNGALEQFRAQIALINNEIEALEAEQISSRRESAAELARLKELLGE